MEVTGYNQERQRTAYMKDEILSFNKKFVEEKRYEQYAASKYPEKKIAILTCMDTRLVELLPAALGLKNGDVKMIKNAGAMINAPFGSAVRSILVAIFELGVNEIMIIGHTDCGVQHIDSNSMIEHMIDRGIDKKLIDMISYSGVDFDAWLSGFESVEQSVRNNVAMLKAHPLIPEDVRIEGFEIDSETGELTPVEENL